MLGEAADWTAALGERMWDESELDARELAADVEAGEFFVAFVNGDIAGAVRFQLEDRLYWPDIESHADSAFVHKLVVRKECRGMGVSTALLAWAADRARALGKRYLRLDCDASRPKLHALYERFGFRFQSYRQVGPHYVARYELPLERAT